MTPESTRLMMTRRDLRRQQTINDIKDTARHQLGNGGPSAISIRAIARHQIGRAHV